MKELLFCLISMICSCLFLVYESKRLNVSRKQELIKQKTEKDAINKIMSMTKTNDLYSSFSNVLAFHEKILFSKK